MAVFSPTNAKVHFKAYDGNFTDTLGNVTVHQHNSVSMSTAETIFGQKSMYMSDFNQAVSFTPDSTFDVGTGDYTVGFWFHPTQFTSWDRLFVTDPYEDAQPLRIYNHNGSINVYAESTTDGTNTHDYMMGYSLGNLSGVNNWYHIMVKRDSGTTKLYINGVERASSTMSYSITSSNTIVLGADTDRGMTGVKGYIADFFWTEDAISFTQADFTPATAEPITFHSGNPSISSFSTSANSVENSGDSVNLLWTAGVAGETKLELLKYVGGILSSTENVLGLYSKSVAITETVSYKLRATNDNGSVDSSLVEITLNGGSGMPKINANGSNLGLVVQKSMVRSSSELASVLVVKNYLSGAAPDHELNNVIEDAAFRLASGDTRHASGDTRFGSADTRVSSADTRLGSADTRLVSADTRIGSVDTRVAADEAALAADVANMLVATASIGIIEAALAAEVAATNTDVTNLQTANSSQDTRHGSADTRFGSADTKLASVDVRAGDIETANSSQDTRHASADTRFGSADTKLSSVDVRAGNIETANTSQDTRFGSADTRIGSVDTRVAADEAALAADVANMLVATSSIGDLVDKDASHDVRHASADTRFGSADTRFGSADTKLGSVDTRVAADEAALAADVANMLVATASIGIIEAALAAEVAATNTDVSNLQTANSSQDTRHGSADTRFGSADTRLVSVDTRAGEIEVAFAAADSSQDTRFGSADTRLTSADTRFGSADTKLASVDVRAGDIETANSSQDTRHGSADTRLVSADTRLVSADTRLTSADTRLSSIDTKFAWGAGTNSGGTLEIDGKVEMVFEDSAALGSGDAMTLIIKKA